MKLRILGLLPILRALSLGAGPSFPPIQVVSDEA